jgi:hypothetical protein
MIPASSRLLATTLVLSMLALVLPAQAQTFSKPEDNHSVVRVTTTGQNYDFYRPWLKKAPFQRRALGTILSGNRILVTAEVVSNAAYVELEKAEGGAKTPATVKFVDYELNLALLEAPDVPFFADLKPVELTEEAKVGSPLEIWQLESNGALAPTEGNINTVELGRYPEELGRLLLYRMSISLQFRDPSICLPAMFKGKLAGLLMRYDSRSQNATILPAPVITQFLRDTDDGTYTGIGRAGISYSTLRDPQLRRYAKADKEKGGVYLSYVSPDSPAEKAGIKEGDVLLSLDGNAIDQDGNYADARFGKIGLENLLATKTANSTVTMKLLRDGKPVDATVTLTRRAPSDYVSAPYLYDSQPRYVVLGGLVFQELSRQYLREWGPTWPNNAPQELVYQDAFQDQLFGKDKGHIIVLSQVLPTPGTIGYERLNGMIVTKLNGVDIHSLEDLDKASLKPINGFQKIEFDEDPKVIYLDNDLIEKEKPILQKAYSLPRLKYLGDPAKP